MVSPLLIFTVGFALIALVLFAYAAKAFGRRRYLGGVSRIVFGTLLMSLALLAATASVAMQGYQALTREVTAATVTISQTEPRRFMAVFTLPDGSTERFQLAGDELYVDAHILKWHPSANMLGLHTGYALDRVAGRYRLLDDEQTQPRTVYSLKSEKPVDMFELVSRYRMLEHVVDAEYGSATFAPVRDGARYAVLVSTSGLLVRPSD